MGDAVAQLGAHADAREYLGRHVERGEGGERGQVFGGRAELELVTAQQGIDAAVDHDHRVDAFGGQDLAVGGRERLHAGLLEGMHDVARPFGIATIEEVGQPRLGAVAQLGRTTGVEAPGCRDVEVLDGALDRGQVGEREAGQRVGDVAGAQFVDERERTHDVVAATAAGEQHFAGGRELRRDWLGQHRGSVR